MNIEELGRTPISEDSPAGHDVTYEPDFEALQQEIDKLSIATAGAGEVDWVKVQDLCGRILAEQSKNLLVGAYLAVSLIKNEQFAGVCKGTQFLKDLVDTFWDTLYPPKKRKKGRINALTWWYERVETFLKSFDPAPLPAEQVRRLQEDLKVLDTLLSEKTDDGPILRPLVQYAERLPVEKAEPEIEETPEPTQEQDKEQQPVPPEQPAPKPAPAPAPAKADTIESDKDARKVLNSCFDTLLKVANFYFQKDLSNPLPFILNRMKAWMDVDQLPMVQEGNTTPLPAPDPIIKSGLEGQLRSKEYEGVVQGAESRLREFIFWLDLNRLCVQGLEELGGKYAKASDAVCQETARFIHKLPGVEKLCFSDGTPFADGETKAWLKSLAGSQQTRDETPVVQEGGVQQEIGQLEAEAGKLHKEKKMIQAVGLFEEKIQKAASKREELLYRMALSTFWLHAGKGTIALPHVDEALTLIDTYSLELWEPDLAAQAMRIAYRVYSNEQDGDLEKKNEYLLSRINKIKPSVAMSILENE